MKPVLPIALTTLALAGCATVERHASCPAGQERLTTAQFFLGRKSEPAAKITEAALRRFVDEEISPNFPDGMTVLDGGNQWRGSDNWLMREAAKVVLIVLPTPEADAGRRLEAVRQAYRTRFRQDAALLIAQPSCVVL